MSDSNKLRFYIDQAIMERDYEALAAFEDQLDTLEDLHSNRDVGRDVDCDEDEPLPEAPIWAPEDGPL